ncbi:MAG: OsmC family protein [Bacteroidia bacterium]|nr:OsmC family protein [Bacteroidia bacterium]
MGKTNHVTTRWMGKMAFESTNPSGNNLRIDAGEEDGGEGSGYRPKALMLSSMAGCTGLDVASLMKKMKLDVDDFTIEIVAELSDEHPQIYEKVTMEYHFHGSNLNEKKLQKAIDLSFDKYCGVSEMFKKFADVQIASFFHHTS